MKSFEIGDLCIGPVVTWLQENASGYIIESKDTQIKTKEKVKNKTFTRMWIYSHHIYSKVCNNFFTFQTTKH